MSKTASAMVSLGTPAPHFKLIDVTTGQHVALNDDQSSTATVIMFLCNHCPFVKHVNTALAQLANDYQSQGIRFIAINANDVEHYPDDSPENMKKIAEEHHYPFPYLFDETQAVAKAYNAACTPDFFIYNQKSKLVYRGQLDDSRPGNTIPVSGNDIRKALDCLIQDIALNPDQKPSIGCNIKWKEQRIAGI